MSGLRDVRRLALALPETAEGTSYGNRAWLVRGKSFAWERPLGVADVAALGEAAPAGVVLAVRTDGLEMKDALLASDSTLFFTTPHFDGYAAVLIRLDEITPAKLRLLLVDAWLARAPKTLAARYLGERRVQVIERLEI